jgi:hypothetical protein
VWNYEHTPGITSPRRAEDVNVDILRSAILEGWNVRYGRRVTDFR